MLHFKMQTVATNSMYIFVVVVVVVVIVAIVVHKDDFHLKYKT